MIGVGINENVMLKSAGLDDKNVLSLVFEEFTGEKLTGFEALQADDVIESNGMTIRVWPPKAAGDEKPDEKKVELAEYDLNKVKGQLLHIAKGYLPSDQVKLDMFAGTGIDKTNYREKVIQQPLLDAMHLNMCKQFLSMIAPFLGDGTKLFRLLLVRQTKDKHFPALRGKFINENPFFESMAIPADATKLKFTKYEIQEGLNDGTPMPRDKADKVPAPDAPGTETPPAMSAASVFGQ